MRERGAAVCHLHYAQISASIHAAWIAFGRLRQHAGLDGHRSVNSAARDHITPYHHPPKPQRNSSARAGRD
jgi:hypothetical protein